MVVFYLFNRLEQPLVGALLAGGWGLGLGLFWYWRSGRVDPFAGMMTGVAVIQIITTVVTRNPAMFLASEAIEDGILSLVFLGSLLGSRSLIQLFAEEMGVTANVSERLRQSPSYAAAWRIVTAVWGGIYLLKAGLLLLAQWSLALEPFLIIRVLSGAPVWACLFAFSFWFPRWYWRRQ